MGTRNMLQVKDWKSQGALHCKQGLAPSIPSDEHVEMPCCSECCCAVCHLEGPKQGVGAANKMPLQCFCHISCASEILLAFTLAVAPPSWAKARQTYPPQAPTQLAPAFSGLVLDTSSNPDLIRLHTLCWRIGDEEVLMRNEATLYDLSACISLSFKLPCARNVPNLCLLVCPFCPLPQVQWQCSH